MLGALKEKLPSQQNHPVRSAGIEHICTSIGDAGVAGDCADLEKWQTQLQQEQDMVRDKHGDEFAPKAMAAMPYALSTVKEVLRILPTAPGIWR